MSSRTYENDRESLLTPSLVELSAWRSLLTGEAEHNKLLQNFIRFVTLFCTTHAVVDAILAFSSAELGLALGSRGSFVLYLLYTLSALLIAKPTVARLGAKNGVLFGLIGMMCYVSAFFFALNSTHAVTKEAIWLIGTALGGVGAGVLWTAEGTYFSLNAQQYARAVMAQGAGAEAEVLPTGAQPVMSSASSRSVISEEKAISASLYTFASIFAAGYLLLETVFKVFATATYMTDNTKNGSAWKSVVFGLYTLFGCVAVLIFAWRVKPFFSAEDYRTPETSGGVDVEEIKRDTLEVMKAIYRDRKLQLLLPYQICFGFSSSMVNTFIVAQVISTYIGDGYVGFLSALTTMTAVALSYPFTLVANRYLRGKYLIMLVGAAAFLLCGLALLLPVTTLGSWPLLVFYFIIYGFGRGAWENTNKAVVADYFGESSSYVEEEGEDVEHPSGHSGRLSAAVVQMSVQSAYASVYFTSGLSAAIGYASYASMSQGQIAALNIFVPISAAIAFHASYRVHEAQESASHNYLADGLAGEEME